MNCFSPVRRAAAGRYTPGAVPQVRDRVVHRRLRGGDPHRPPTCSSPSPGPCGLEPVRSSPLTGRTYPRHRRHAGVQPRAGSWTCERRVAASRRPSTAARGCTGRAPAARRAGTAHPRARAERRRLVADRGRALTAAARDHVRQPRDRPSESLTPAYTTEAMADDAVAVLDAPRPRGCRARLRDLARRHGRAAAGAAPPATRAVARPRARRSRVAGGLSRADDEVMAFFRRRSTMRHGGGRLASVPYNYGPRCRAEHHVDRIADDIERRLAHPFNAYAYRAQLFAAALHNCYGGWIASASRRSSCTASTTG